MEADTSVRDKPDKDQLLRYGRPTTAARVAIDADPDSTAIGLARVMTWRDGGSRDVRLAFDFCDAVVDP